MDTKNKVIVFDLDDTIYKEIEFLKSGYGSIINKLDEDFSIELNIGNLLKDYYNGTNVFEKIVNHNISKKVTVAYLLDIYRNHIPDIIINYTNKQTIVKLKEKGFILGIITDGRVKTQRNKLKALGINMLFDEILISEEFGSEKTNENNFLHFEAKYPEFQYYYIGDNIAKDFVIPNGLGWTTIGLRDVNSLNIHSQKVNVPIEFLPKFWVDSLEDIQVIL